MSQGLFITFEGGEGTGKSVQCALLYERLQRHFADQVLQRPLLRTREPGGSSGAEAIRPLLTTGDKDRWLPISEALLFYAARYDHWKRTILPILQKGGIVLCDRFFDSSRVYQGTGRGLPPSFFEALHRLLGETDSPSNPAEHPFCPDRTYILDLDPRLGIARSNHRQEGILRKEDRFEQIDLTFHEKVRQGYQALAQAEPTRCRLIPADHPIEELHEALWQDVLQWI